MNKESNFLNELMRLDSAKVRGDELRAQLKKEEYCGGSSRTVLAYVNGHQEPVRVEISDEAYQTISRDRLEQEIAKAFLSAYDASVSDARRKANKLYEELKMEFGR